MPVSAVSVCREVRAELMGGPISSTPATTTTTLISASAYRYHDRVVRTFTSAPAAL
jgi:hypothetical protein